jgi:hypothetical protein
MTGETRPETATGCESGEGDGAGYKLSCKRADEVALQARRGLRKSAPVFGHGLI